MNILQKTNVNSKVLELSNEKTNNYIINNSIRSETFKTRDGGLSPMLFIIYRILP